MSIETVRENCKRVSRLIKKVKDNPGLFFDLGRRGVSLIEAVYLVDQGNAVFLLDFMPDNPPSRIQQAIRRLRWRLRWEDLGLSPGRNMA